MDLLRRRWKKCCIVMTAWRCNSKQKVYWAVYFRISWNLYKYPAQLLQRQEEWRVEQSAFHFFVLYLTYSMFDVKRELIIILIGYARVSTTNQNEDRQRALPPLKSVTSNSVDHQLQCRIIIKRIMNCGKIKNLSKTSCWKLWLQCSYILYDGKKYIFWNKIIFALKKPEKTLT